MMKSLKYFRITALLLALVIISSCEKDKDGNNNSKKLRVEFNLLNSAGEKIDLGETITLSNGFDLRVDVFKAYFSNITLYDTTSTNQQLIKDVALVGLGSSSENYFEVSSFTPESYNMISFGLGLTPQVNNSDPTSFSNNHPLSSYQNMYWSMLKYRFIKFEGVADSTGNQVIETPVNYGLAYHTGTDPLYEEIYISHDFEIKNGNNIIEVNINIDELFASSQDPINLLLEQQTHSDPSSIALAQKFTDNTIAAISVNQK